MNSVSKARITLAVLCIAGFAGTTQGQIGATTPTSQTCADAIAQSSGSHRFRRVGETIEIPIAPVQKTEEAGAEGTSGATECYPIALELYWSNGRNQGGVYRVTFLDSRDQPVFGREISAFMVGNVEFPINGMGAGKTFGRSMFSIPTKITIQTKEPFGSPAGVSYSVVWVEPKQRKELEPERKTKVENTAKSQTGNDVVRVRRVERLIGSSRVPLVQMELKAAQAFPVREVPLRLRIGQREFLTELSGDYTGRLLTLSLTPEMFAELTDGAEISAFFDERESWSFGKLQKSLLK